VLKKLESPLPQQTKYVMKCPGTSAVFILVTRCERGPDVSVAMFIRGAENSGVENEAVSHSMGAHRGTAQLAATDDCCEVCLVAPREGFALVPRGHAGFCESCALRVANLHSCCPVCRAPIRMVMRVFFLNDALHMS